MLDNIEIKLYKKRIEHSKKEHKYERYATYFLLIILFIMLIGIIFKAEIICFYIMLPIVMLATMTRILAGYHHKKEKKIYSRIKNKR